MIVFVSKVEQLFAMGLISQQKQQGESAFFFFQKMFRFRFMNWMWLLRDIANFESLSSCDAMQSLFRFLDTLLIKF